ncbi:hypothetical protein [Dickeya fangzhongdai]|uniref:hypothetical protein n=1 Tax=Dickeya fangzhongdai TaxID=1778540 RepID=UPI0026DFB2CF|nr:hypothetical protein [Dickeya fangzhongdai]WKV52598.1 hypothetical protein PL145_10510 [Dickeya fangzhongdai]
MPIKNNKYGEYDTTPDWMTIQEAVKLANKTMKEKIKDSDIYRNALHGSISLSIYFQSPFIMRKIKLSNEKPILKPIEDSLLSRLCFLDKKSFLDGLGLIFSTEGKYFYATHQIIDTKLIGYEHVLIQRLLANSLKIHKPIIGIYAVNYGITVSVSGEIFQIFSKMEWIERVQQQIKRLPDSFSSMIAAQIPSQNWNNYCSKEFFPLYDLPRDACFVIKHTELEKLMNKIIKPNRTLTSSTRISTPLSRFLWLACKNNDSIRPLIRQPYKLLSIFEQWASAEGITDQLSGDTLKTALRRGSPPSTKDIT